MAYLTKSDIASALTTRAEADHPAPLLGGTLRIRELLRGESAALADVQNDAEDYDLFNLSVFALGVIDPETKQPLLTLEEARALTERAGAKPEERTRRWGEVRDTAQAILHLSEVGPAHLKSGDPAIDAG